MEEGGKEGGRGGEEGEGERGGEGRQIRMATSPSAMELIIMCYDHTYDPH